MKKLMRGFILGLLLPVSFSASGLSPVIPQQRAVKINVGSVGGKADSAALRAIRQVIGYGIASGAVDTFTVYSPKLGTRPIEGGFSACAEAGFYTHKAIFAAFIQDLKTIRTNSGMFYTVEPALSCSADVPVVEEPVMCTMEVMACPDGVSYVGRTGPSCEFAPCPQAIKAK